MGWYKRCSQKHTRQVWLAWRFWLHFQETTIYLIIYNSPFLWFLALLLFGYYGIVLFRNYGVGREVKLMVFYYGVGFLGYLSVFLFRNYGVGRHYSVGWEPKLLTFDYGVVLFRNYCVGGNNCVGCQSWAIGEAVTTPITMMAETVNFFIIVFVFELFIYVVVSALIKRNSCAKK